ncbi:MAG: SusD/RagB family nutrient-binding outer membrane lipoprotein [Bacteroidota bacterium]|nr:SusD/RagB family nutrient-binding outer membrane lipoprotein [Bacteroidota bacterium]
MRNKKVFIFLAALCSFLLSCEDLSETNLNPNGIIADNVHPNLVLPTVLTEAARIYVNLGYQDIAGVVQHTQKDAWFEGHNDYDWAGGQDWAGYYSVLRNNDLVYERAVEMKLEFHQGVALVMNSFMFGLVADLWGDAPYTNALKGESGKLSDVKPSFDSQETIYNGILANLETANTLLSKNENEYDGIEGDADVFFDGDPEAWRRFANSLALRYYMRISAKSADVAKAGIEKIVGNPSQYPIITSSDEDVTMGFPGTSPDTSWPASTAFDPSESNYKRIKMAATLVEALQTKNDPRLAVWASKVQMPLVVDAGLPPGTDKKENGKRYLSPDKLIDSNGNPIAYDTDPEYVGLPTGLVGPSAYNLNETPGQTSNNLHVSYLNPIYKASSGELLKARLISAAEVHFILAEAAVKGWAAGDAEEHYEEGVRASLETWKVDDDYATYIAEPEVIFPAAGTDAEKLEQIIEQKWIASWTAATEAWFDFRRTGLPTLTAGPHGQRGVLPVRFYYAQNELMLNSDNAGAAVQGLEVTSYSQADGNNSAWSKPWLIKGTGKPW